MDNADTVYNAVIALYHGNNITAKENASVWLGEFQKSLYAWQVSDALLHQRRDTESCYFAAQTMRSKVQFSFDELPADSYASLRDSLIQHLSNCDTSTSHVIVIQLCLALADLALQMVQWKTAAVDLIQRFACSEHMSVLLEFLTVLPEEAYSRSLRLGANRREEICSELIAQSDTVVKLLNQLVVGSNAENAEVLSRILKCLASWLSIGALLPEPIAQSPIVQIVFRLLSTPTVPSGLHDAAADCLVKALVLVEDTTKYASLAAALQTLVYDLVPTFHSCVASEDLDKVQNFGRIFVELAESLLNCLVDSPGRGLGNLHTLELVLLNCGFHDYTLAEMTFNFWYRLSEIVYQTDSEPLTQLFRPYMVRLVLALYKHCRFDVDQGDIPDETDDLCDFRRKASECVKDVVFIVESTSCFAQMLQVLQSLGPNSTWDETEAALYIMTAIAKNLIPDEDEVVPSVVHAMLQLPVESHVCVKYTSLRLLGELDEWIAAHPDCIGSVVALLLKNLHATDTRQLAPVAAQSLEAICMQCRALMLPHISDMLVTCNMAEQLQLPQDCVLSVLRATATVISLLSLETLAEAFKQLVHLQARWLAEIVNAGDSDAQHRSAHDPVTWLDRLAAIFRQTSPVVPAGVPHPCLPVIQELWPLLSATCDKYQTVARTMERCCRTIRFAVRCLGTQSHSLLQPLVTQMVAIYQRHPHSCFLYLGSILVDEYGKVEACQRGLVQMLEAFVEPTFKLFETTNGLRNHPDTVDDFCRLALRFVQRAPEVFFQSAVCKPLVQFALSAVALDHKDANQSVTKFLSELVDFVATAKRSKSTSACVNAADEVVRCFGPAMVHAVMHAAVFALPASLARECAEVLFALSSFDVELFAGWLGASLQQFPTQGVGGVATAKPEQLQQFHADIVGAVEVKTITHALREFARLFR